MQGVAAARLVEDETVDGSVVNQLLGLPQPEHQQAGTTLAPERAAAPAHAASRADPGPAGTGPQVTKPATPQPPKPADPQVTKPGG